jgi:hypothetical protein
MYSEIFCNRIKIQQAINDPKKYMEYRNSPEFDAEYIIKVFGVSIVTKRLMYVIESMLNCDYLINGNGKNLILDKALHYNANEIIDLMLPLNCNYYKLDIVHILTHKENLIKLFNNGLNIGMLKQSIVSFHTVLGKMDIEIFKILLDKGFNQDDLKTYKSNCYNLTLIIAINNNNLELVQEICNLITNVRYLTDFNSKNTINPIIECAIKKKYKSLHIITTRILELYEHYNM